MTRDQMIEQLRERIVAFATSRGRREVAEDLAQEVLMVLHEKYPQVTELTELVPLSFQILRFKILDLHRKTLRRGEYHQESIDDRPLADPGDDPAVQAEQKEQVGQLIDGLQQLGERCRELFRLKLQGHTFSGNSTDIVGERSIRHHFIPGTPAVENNFSLLWEDAGKSLSLQLVRAKRKPDRRIYNGHILGTSAGRLCHQYSN